MDNRKLKALLELFRPELPFSAGVCVLLGEIIALGNFPSPRGALVGFICGFFISAAALIWNDYFDLAVDRINAPQRPLPSGRVTPREVILLGVFVTLLGLAVSAFISAAALLLCIVFWWIGFLYNWKLKAAGLWGNLMVAASVGVTFILGGMIAGQPWNPLVWLFSLVAFLIDLGEEIAGDAMDMEGDRQRGSKSLPMRIGKTSALRISALIFAAVVAVSYLPVVFGWLGLTYGIIITLTNIALVFFTLRLLNHRTDARGRSSMRGIYLTALFGMLAFIVGQMF